MPPAHPIVHNEGKNIVVLSDQDLAILCYAVREHQRDVKQTFVKQSVNTLLDKMGKIEHTLQINGLAATDLA